MLLDLLPLFDETASHTGGKVARHLGNSPGKRTVRRTVEFSWQFTLTVTGRAQHPEDWHPPAVTVTGGMFGGVSLTGTTLLPSGVVRGRCDLPVLCRTFPGAVPPDDPILIILALGELE